MSAIPILLLLSLGFLAAAVSHRRVPTDGSWFTFRDRWAVSAGLIALVYALTTELAAGNLDDGLLLSAVSIASTLVFAAVVAIVVHGLRQWRSARRR